MNRLIRKAMALGSEHKEAEKDQKCTYSTPTAAAAIWNPDVKLTEVLVYSFSTPTCRYVTKQP